MPGGRPRAGITSRHARDRAKRGCSISFVPDHRLRVSSIVTPAVDTPPPVGDLPTAAASSASPPAAEAARRPEVAVVVPCYRVRRHVLEVLAAIPAEVARIYVVDDACPQRTGELVAAECRDPRVRVLVHEHNQGVGGATVTGYRAALAAGADVVVKLDGDGQMDPALLPRLVAPLLRGDADYTKGNRFFTLESLAGMPPLRLQGNAALSFLTKLATGYWDVFDPANGYTAIHAKLLPWLPLDLVSRRFAFESDLLFRLGTLRAVVVDVPMAGRYGDEESNLRVLRVAPELLWRNVANATKRIFYSYFLRGFSIASVNLLLGGLLIACGGTFGAWAWYRSASTGVVASSGTVMAAALPVLAGIQLVLSFLSFDMASTPRVPVHRRL
jgi:dolichol-phosphate mannosyltransferase